MDSSNGPIAHNPQRLCTAVVGAKRRLWQEMFADVVTHSEVARVVGIATDFAELKGLVAAHQPDLVLARFPFGELERTDVLLELRAIHAGLSLLVVLPPSALGAALGALVTSGGVGVVTTDSSASEMRATIPLLLQGWTVVHPEARAKIFSELSLSFPPRLVSRDLLKDRERYVLQQLSRGQHDQEIAESLGLSIRTVQLDIAHACEKLEALDRMHAVALALTNGLIEPPKRPSIGDVSLEER